jgi:hypothetical protein
MKPKRNYRVPPYPVGRSGCSVGMYHQRKYYRSDKKVQACETTKYEGLIF